MQEYQTLVNRVMNTRLIRSVTLPTELVVGKVIQAYFEQENLSARLKEYQTSMINYDGKATANWISHRKKAPQRLRETM